MTESGQVIYIGQTGRPMTRRFLQHKYYLKRGTHDNTFMQRAWNKYGESSFSFVALENVFDNGLLSEREQYWLDLYKKTSKVFNSGLLIGSPRLGCKHTEEARKKISESHKTRKHYKPSLETRKKMSLAGMGRKFSKETIEKIRIAKTGHLVSDETRKKISIARKGKPGNHHPCSEATKEKLRVMFTGRRASDETKMKQSIAMRGRTFSDEHRRKISEKKKGHGPSEKTILAHVRNYPSFFNVLTGEIAPFGKNLAKFCRENGLDRKSMERVANGTQKLHRNWQLAGG